MIDNLIITVVGLIGLLSILVVADVLARRYQWD
jgi:hypothetical protein